MHDLKYGVGAGARVVGAFLFFAGLSAMWFGAHVLLYGPPAALAGTSCQVICGLTRLSALLLGPLAGQVMGGALTLLMGLGVAFVGRALYKR